MVEKYIPFIDSYDSLTNNRVNNTYGNTVIIQVTIINHC